VLPAADYPVTLTLNRPLRLESLGGVARIGTIADQTNNASRLPPFVTAAAAPSLVVAPNLPPPIKDLINELFDYLEEVIAEGIEAGVAAVTAWVGIPLPPLAARAIAASLADSLVSGIRAEVVPDGSAQAGGVTLQLPESYENCRHVVHEASKNPQQDDWYLGTWEKKAPRYNAIPDTQRMRVSWQLTPQPDNTRSWLDLHTLLIGVRHDLVGWARQTGYCTPLP
jgi:hypothetical protein